MKVYMVYETYAFSTSNIIGVYKSLEKAEAVKKSAQDDYDQACKQLFVDGDNGDLTFEEYLEDYAGQYLVDIEELEVQE